MTTDFTLSNAFNEKITQAVVTKCKASYRNLIFVTYFQGLRVVHRRHLQVNGSILFATKQLHPVLSASTPAALRM